MKMDERGGGKTIGRQMWWIINSFRARNCVPIPSLINWLSYNFMSQMVLGLFYIKMNRKSEWLEFEFISSLKILSNLLFNAGNKLPMPQAIKLPSKSQICLSNSNPPHSKFYCLPRKPIPHQKRILRWLLLGHCEEDRLVKEIGGLGQKAAMFWQNCGRTPEEMRKKGGDLFSPNWF